MKKSINKLAIAGALLFSSTAFAQLQDEQNVTVTMDLQPILQLNMNTSDQLNFVFDDMSDYYAGITRYGATILTVSSTVSWDLYAVGTSTNGTLFWDNPMTYGTSADPLATRSLPLELLELHQNRANAFTTAGTGFRNDYSSAFSTPVIVPGSPSTYLQGVNNIYSSISPYTAPAVTEKYIQGHKGVADAAPGGSYLTHSGAALTSNYYYSIDYRIIPGLPVVFPTAATNATPPVSKKLDALVANTYAQPGVYTMNVKYVLLENQ